jgi:predicted membrane protein
MEVLLFTLFFIVSLIFFIAGKDDFGREEKKLILKDKEKEDIKNEMELKRKEEVKKEVDLKST